MAGPVAGLGARLAGVCGVTDEGGVAAGEGDGVGEAGG